MSPLLTNLVSYYKLDEASGNRADSAGPNTLTNTGTVSSATGIINLGADFSGANQLRNTSPSGLPSPSTSFSIQAWVKFTFTNSRQKGIFCGDNAGWSGLLCTTISTGKVQFSWYNGSSFFTVTSANAINDGNWHHLVAVRDLGAATSELYVDSVSQGTVGTSGTPQIYLPEPWEAIGQFGGDYFTGVIDEVGYWTRVLTAAEVIQLYNGGAALAYPFSTPSPISGFFAQMLQS